MKKLLSVAVLLVLSVAVFAQTEVTKFLGIPVDGTKPAMIQKLKAKGFQYNAVGDYLTGEFNGQDVNIHVGTNNNKVYRIMVADKNYVSESDIKIRFNNLVLQFNKNQKYFHLSDQTLSDEENISYGMTVNKKRYEATFFQVADRDSTTMRTIAENMFLSKYTADEIVNMDEEKKYKAFTDVLFDSFTKYSVWFVIDELYGKYGILMFYDNGFNKSDDEDL